MTIITDSGSTKCDWITIDDNGIQLFEKVRTKGLNPAILTPGELMGRIQESDKLMEHKKEVDHIYFYGAGCGTEEPSMALKRVLEKIFPNAEVTVAEDTLAAIYSAIDNNEPAVVCILGTGSNCTYYDGEKIDQRVKSLGYILMDDASGNYFGKQLIRDYFFKHMPENLRVSMAERYNMDEDFIKYNLYKQPNPNAYLANFAEFLFLNKDNSYCTDLIKKGVRIFAENMIMQFKEELKTVPVHFAGSIAYYGQEQIKEVAKEMGFRVGNFVRRPIEGLVHYHAKNIK
ncbi:N-acetylglucosamine kinase [Aureibaculum marinum]|uniref:N-acetylglucosamine kinase n=1 Tax=Aureibaculum marinum TaxID=2487930 RepID=A0A3N4NXZ6_9FLAO|nr:N-acetylglucosamine kinase [Aureibaculum marinum]RPE00776.1 N-acetylglucosamine kinase [Aureibaculum marinum]